MWRLVARRNNLGLHASWNEGVEWARSKYFMVLCADDFLVPDCFATTISVMEQQPKVGFAFGRPAYLRPKDTRPLPPIRMRKGHVANRARSRSSSSSSVEGVNHVPGSGVLGKDSRAEVVAIIALNCHTLLILKCGCVSHDWGQQRGQMLN